MCFDWVLLSMTAIGALFLSSATTIGALHISDDEHHQISRDLTLWQQKFW